MVHCLIRHHESYKAAEAQQLRQELAETKAQGDRLREDCAALRARRKMAQEGSQMGQGGPRFCQFEQLPAKLDYSKPVSNLLGGGKSKKCPSDAVDNPFLGALTELVKQFEPDAFTKPVKKQPSKNKPTLREALAKVLAKPSSGRSLLDKLKSIIRGAEGGHYADEGPSPKPSRKAAPETKGTIEEKGQQQPKKSILKQPKLPVEALTEKASNVQALSDCHLRSADCPKATIMRAQPVLSKLHILPTGGLKRTSGAVWALAAYVSGAPAVVDGVLAKSGASHVSKLAKHKVTDESLHGLGDAGTMSPCSSPLHGWAIVEAGGAGACGYRALIAASIFDSKLGAKLNKEDVFMQAASLRVATAQHFRKCEGRFRPSWSIDPPNLDHSGASWEEYVAKQGRFQFHTEDDVTKYPEGAIMRQFTDAGLPEHQEPASSSSSNPRLVEDLGREVMALEAEKSALADRLTQLHLEAESREVCHGPFVQNEAAQQRVAQMQ
eukprot:Skav229368  [mRNA]  locus=scaffold584:11843:16986:- [translate_table: standard]